MRAVALVGARMVSAHTAEELVAILKEATDEILAEGDLSLGHYDPVARTMSFTGGNDAGIPIPPTTVSIVGTPSERVIRERKTLVTHRSDDPAAQGAKLVGTGRRSESTIRAPILTEVRVLGVIMAQSYTPSAYSSDDVELLETLASLSASALLNIEAKEALAMSERRLQEAQEIAQLVRWQWDSGSATLTWSPRICEFFGITMEQAPRDLRAYLALVHPADREQVIAVLNQRQAGSEPLVSDHRAVRTDGTVRHLHCRGIVEWDAAGILVRAAGTMQDVTERKELEDRLRQAQKMEAVGQLAGGVAHDFNNLLTAIFVSLEFIKEGLPADHAVLADVEEIGQASDRARSLVRQLLTFSRKQPLRNQRVQLGQIVLRSERLLRRLLGEEILLEVHVAAEDRAVDADPAQVEQVLLNLAVNARDAMLTPRLGQQSTGGTLVIEVDETTLTASDVAASDGAAVGQYVRLRVRDNGHGMDAATRVRVFEPFFTTKDVGAGAGLGLASVFGIVRQLGGAVHVESTPGAGTTFTILIPTAGDEDVDVDKARPATRAAVHTLEERRTILLVEDETPVREMVRRILERRGYTVLEARHGGDALLLWKSHGAVIDALVTDLRMPVMGGRELVDVLLQESPELPVVFMSGYSVESASAANGSRQAFVSKPFASEALTTALGQVLAITSSARGG